MPIEKEQQSYIRDSVLSSLPPILLAEVTTIRNLFDSIGENPVIPFVHSAL